MGVNKDPLGYYSILGVDAAASPEQIKKAFKARAQELHPDKNYSSDSTRDFQRLNEAYEVLGDSNARSGYDANAYILEEQPRGESRVPVQPIPCCVCGKISVRPRYVIYRQVVSILFATYRSGCQGVFCAKCAAARAYKTSGITWLFGWWGIPWGPIYSLQAIFRNMLGDQPAITNFRVLSMQAAHFASENRMDLARLLADQAMEFVPKIPSFGSNHETQPDRDLLALLNAVRDSTPPPARSLKGSWGIKSLPFRIQALAASLVSVVLAVCLVSAASHTGTAYRQVPPSDAFDQVSLNVASSAGAQGPSTNSDASSTAGSVGTPSSVTQSGLQEAAPFNEPVRALPPTGRMHMLRKRSRDATAPLNIVAYNGSPNYYVKLVDLNTNTPVLFLFIRSGESSQLKCPLVNTNSDLQTEALGTAKRTCSAL